MLEKFGTHIDKIYSLLESITVDMCFDKERTNIHVDTRYKEIIAAEFRNCVINTIQRLQNVETYRPFHAALLSDEALFWSRFERSFSTSFGQRVIEEVSRIVALAGGASEASRQKQTSIHIDVAVDAAITSHLNAIRSGNPANNWNETIDEILSVPKTGNLINHHVISDLWWLKDDIDHYMSIKTVKPNIDQTAIAKQDLLRLISADQTCEVYFGLYYNPYGEDRGSYAHNPPMGIFNFHEDPVVLIGRDYWDTLGGLGTYDMILEIANEVGAETRELLEDLY